MRLTEVPGLNQPVGGGGSRRISFAGVGGGGRGRRGARIRVGARAGCIVTISRGATCGTAAGADAIGCGAPSIGSLPQLGNTSRRSLYARTPRTGTRVVF